MKSTEMAQISSSSAFPQPSTIDRLHPNQMVMMKKYLEENQNRVEGADQRGHCMPMDVAVRDLQTKGSILERVALLENRLYQLCLEIEARSCASSTSAAQTSSGIASSRQVSTTTDESHSTGSTNDRNLPYNVNARRRGIRVNRVDFLANSMKNRTESSVQLKQNLISPKDKGDIPSDGHKLKPRRRPWKRLLGC